MNGNQKILSQIEKNPLESICASLIEYHHNEYVDLRIWVKGDKDDRFPTRKGIRVNLELLPDLIQILQQAQDLIEKGLKKNDE